MKSGILQILFALLFRILFLSLFGNVQKTVLLLLVNFVFFGLLFCIVFKYCLLPVGIGSKITVFFCLRDFEPVIDCLQHVLSRVRSGNLLSAALRACEIACNAPPSSTMKGFFFPNNNFNLRGCAGVAATGGTRWHETYPQLHSRKRHFTAC